MSRASSSPEARRVGLAELKSLVPAWDELAAAAAEPNPFYEAWALLPALEAFPDPGFACAAVYRGARLDALFPLQREARYRGLPARTLRSWRNRHMLLCTPLVRAGAEQACFEALLRWAPAGGGASVVELDYLPGDGPLRRALAAAAQARGRPWSVGYAYERALLRRAASAEAYLAAMDRQVRKDLRRRDRRLQEAGRAEYVRLEADIERWIEDFLVLEASGWKGKAGGALACREADARYARTLLRAAFERGRLLATGIDLDGKPIARRLCLLSGEGGLILKSAYDEAHARLAPGRLAHLENIRAFHDRPAGLQWIDSATGPDNELASAVWKDRRRIERVTVAADAWGAFCVSLLPALRWAKRKMTRGERATSAAPASRGTSSPSIGGRP